MSAYHYLKPVSKPFYARRRYFLPMLVILLTLVGYITFDVISTIRNNSNKNQPVSAVQTSIVSDNKNTFTNSYFQFSDYGQWVLDKRISTSNVYTYEKYVGQELQGFLKIYINRTPSEPLLTATRVLPVRLVNDNSFQVTGVSDPCVNQFAQGETHRVKEMTINGATMLCDPSSGVYTVIISQIDGNYVLPLKTSQNKPLQLVITYRNNMVDPQSDTITNVAGSFKAL